MMDITTSARKHNHTPIPITQYPAFLQDVQDEIEKLTALSDTERDSVLNEPDDSNGHTYRQWANDLLDDMERQIVNANPLPVIPRCHVRRKRGRQ